MLTILLLRMTRTRSEMIFAQLLWRPLLSHLEKIRHRSSVQIFIKRFTVMQYYSNSTYLESNIDLPQGGPSGAPLQEQESNEPKRSLCLGFSLAKRYRPVGKHRSILSGPRAHFLYLSFALRKTHKKGAPAGSVASIFCPRSSIFPPKATHS